MAKVLERPSDLYEQDFVAWIEQQLDHLRAGRFEELDLPNLIRELEEMGRSQRRELKSRLEVLLMHLLKRDHAKRRSRSWNSTIIEQRARIADLLTDSQSLRRELERLVGTAWPVAVARASAETGLARDRFPQTLPYSLDAILQDGSNEIGAG